MSNSTTTNFDTEKHIFTIYIIYYWCSSPKSCKKLHGLNYTVVRRAKRGASCQAKDLMSQILARGDYRVLQACQLTH